MIQAFLFWLPFLKIIDMVSWPRSYCCWQHVDNTPRSTSKVLCIIESRWSVLIVAPGLDGIIQQMQYWNIKVYETAATMLGLPDSSKLSLFAGSELINRNADLSLAPIADGAAWLRQGSTNHQGPLQDNQLFLAQWPDHVHLQGIHWARKGTYVVSDWLYQTTVRTPGILGTEHKAVPD